MATKADLLLQTYTLRYEIATVKGEVENLLTPEQYSNTYRYYEQLKKSKLYELKQDVEMLTRALESAKVKKAASEARAAFFSTPEGRAFKSEKEAALEAEQKSCSRYCIDSLQKIESLVRTTLGQYWEVQGLSTSHLQLGVKKDGKPVFGQSVDIYYDRRDWLNENREKFEISVGSTGNFDLEKNEVGDRAKFYMDFGKFLADATLLAALKETIYGYAETINACHDRMDAIKKQLDSPLA